MNSYYYINVKGNINRFINRCIEKNINIYVIKNISYKEIVIKADKENYLKLLKMKGFDYKLIKKTGIAYIINLINKYQIFLITFIFGIFFLIFLSNIVFKVEIVTSNNELNRIIRKELDYYKMNRYSFRKSYKKKEKIKEKIKNKYKDKIEWLEITYTGSLLKVQVVERKTDKINKDSFYSNIVAKKDGVIKNIFVENGMKMVDVNTYVNKGDILISGIIKKDEDIKGLTRSKGKVYASVWYKVSIEYPINYKEIKYTNNYKKNFYIKIGNKYFEIKKYKKYKREKLAFYKNRIVPFEFGIINQNEIKIINKKLSYEMAKEKAIKKIKKDISSKLKDKEIIIDRKTLNFTKKKSKIVLEEFFEVLEEISKEEEIKVE